RKLIKDPTEILTNTSVMAKGRTKGWVILIPRVGMPDASLVKALKLDTLTQLSDCVIALEFSSKNSALKAEGRLHSHWNEFKDLYRGTGARYVTISRLSFWLNSIA
ncbi:hypothetical protein, partial [Mesorhizobium japonicum]|uniref:hypothetical protein n=1 Tax=Mesorhizobium japonicum TaxID=2066070 RepID=UPI003B5AAE68